MAVFNHTIHMLLATLVLPYALVLIVPGPNMFIVLQASLALSGRTALAAAFGIASGATMAAATASYLAAFMPNSRIFQVLGALLFSFFLLRAAAGLFRYPATTGTGETIDGSVVDGRGHFRLGLLAALFNPVTISFFVGFFLAHPQFGTTQAILAACATVFMMAAIWFGALGFALVRSKSLWRLDVQSGWLKYCVALGLSAYAVVALFRLATG